MPYGNKVGENIMKVIVTESRLGVEYIADIISGCDRHGVECIVDDNAGDILYYDPKRAKYGTERFLLDSDVSIWDVLKDDELFAVTMKDAIGDEFKQFAVQWNALQKKGDGDEVFKTSHCNPIRGNFSERRQEVVTGKRKEEFMKRYNKFRDKWHALDKKGDDGLTDAGRAHLERIKNMKDDFGYWVNGVEAQVSESDDPKDGSSSGGEVEIIWTTNQYSDFGIFEGDTSVYVIDYGRVEDHDSLVNELCRLIGKEYPDLDFEVDDFEIVNEREFWRMRTGGRAPKGGVIESDEEDGDSSGPKTMDMEIEFKYDCGDFKEGDRFTVPLDIPKMRKECKRVGDVHWRCAWQFPPFAERKGLIPKGEGFKYTYPNVIRILNIDEVTDAIFGGIKEYDYAHMSPKDFEGMDVDEALDFCRNMQEAYRRNRVDSRRAGEIREMMVDGVVKGLLARHTVEELADEWFIDYGCMNGWDWATALKHEIACALHRIHYAKHPDEHGQVEQDRRWRGWREKLCKCGLGSSSDSSD